MGPIPIAVTPLVLAPLAVLGLLFPALVAGPFLLVRRWWVFLNVCTINSTLFAGCVVFRGVRVRYWWAAEPYLWGALGVVCLAGAYWAWYRRGGAQGNREAGRPWPTEIFVLGLVSVLGLATVAYCLLDARPLWHPLLTVWVAAWAGFLYALIFRRTGQPILPLQAVMLAAMAVPCAAHAASAWQYAGVVRWTFAADDRGAVVSQPLVADDRVYVGAALQGVQPWGGLYCIDPANGKARWRFTDNHRLKPVWSSPCQADGRVFFCDGSSRLSGSHCYGLDAETGTELWRFPKACAPGTSPAVEGGHVFLAAGADGIYGLDAATGVEAWHYGQGPAVSTPAVQRGRLYAATGKEVLCLDARTGHVLWRTGSDLPTSGPPAVGGDEVWIGLGDGDAGALLCLDASDGRRRWHRPVGGAVLARPVCDERNVYCGARDGRVYALSHSGFPCWTQSVGSPIESGPVLVGRRLYGVTRAGDVFALDTATGGVTGRFNLAGYAHARPHAFSCPTVTGGRIYVGVGLDHLVTGLAAELHCLDEPAIATRPIPEIDPAGPR